jgi:hypothetical protein
MTLRTLCTLPPGSDIASWLPRQCHTKIFRKEVTGTITNSCRDVGIRASAQSANMVENSVCQAAESVFSNATLAGLACPTGNAVDKFRDTNHCDIPLAVRPAIAGRASILFLTLLGHGCAGVWERQHLFGRHPGRECHVEKADHHLIETLLPPDHCLGRVGILRIIG